MVYGTVLGIVVLVCAILVIYDVLVNRKGLSDGMKIFWVILAIIFSIVIAVIYFLVGRNSDSDLFRARRVSR